MSKADADATPESDAFPDAPHPRHATRLVGHRAAETEMLAAYRERRLAHAWLIGGPEGVGKATLAWRFARFVLANPDPGAPRVREAADLGVAPESQAARNLAAHAHPDFSIARREWNAKAKSFASEISVDGVRQALQVFHLSAAFGGWRVCLVDCAEDLNRNGANALLKMIEEPPERALILIVAHRPGQVLATIRSRCRKLKLEPLAPAEIVEVVAGLGPPFGERGPEAIRAAAERAGGSVREALARLSSSHGVGALIDAAVASLPRADPRSVAKLAEALSGRAADEALQALHRAVLDWIAAYAREPGLTPQRRERLSALWDRVRAAARETEALNLDRKMHVLAMFADIAGSLARR